MHRDSPGISSHIACVGDNCIDHYLPPIGRRFAAGNAINVAVWLRRGGFAVDYFGAVGDDDDGSLILAALAAEGVGIDNVAALPSPTSVTDIVVSPHGEREFVRVAEGAAEEYEPDREVVAALSAYRLAHAVNISDHTILTDPLLAAGVPVTYDFDTCAQPVAVDGLTMVFFSPEVGTTPADVDDLVADAVRRGARAAIAMCGPNGSVGCDARGLVRVPAAPVAAIDTCGAGDSYIAAVIAGHLAGGGLDTCMHAGAALAATVCGHVGALPPGVVPSTVSTASIARAREGT
jgi:fructoselysine 6-kinase